MRIGCMFNLNVCKCVCIVLYGEPTQLFYKITFTLSLNLSLPITLILSHTCTQSAHLSFIYYLPLIESRISIVKIWMYVFACGLAFVCILCVLSNSTKRNMSSGKEGKTRKRGGLRKELYKMPKPFINATNLK